MGTEVRIVGLDFETLGTTSWSSPIIQAGFWAIDLDLETHRVEQYGMLYNALAETAVLSPCDAAALQTAGISKDTLAWHLKTLASTEANLNSWEGFEAAWNAAVARHEAKPAIVVCQNNEFDLIFLKRRWSLPWPAYDFRRTIDVRTLQVLGLLPEKLPGKNHTALEDAKAQVEAVVHLILAGKIEIKGYLK